MRLTWPWTGRSTEMRLIEAALSDPMSAGIVVSGEAGVGKSRIALEAIRSAASRGCETRWVVGTSCAHGLPLGALARWASPESDSLQLVCDVIESLTAGAPATKVVIGVDDVNLLDDLSIFVLHQIVQRRSATLVLTVRDAGFIPAGVQELFRVGQFDRLDLQPLSPEESAELLSAALSGSPNSAAVERLWQLTRGNCLYLRHIVEQEVNDGRLEEQHGSWRWLGDPILPRGLTELIETRIGALPGPVSTVIDALAIGEPIQLAALRRIADPDAVEDADARGLISLDHLETGIDVRLAHPLYGEVRRERGVPTRLRRLRGMVAAELAAADDWDDPQVLVRRATLALDSDLPPDAELLALAAQSAIRLADLPLADRLAAAAVRADAGPEAQFTRAHALSWLGRGQDAEEVLAAVPIAQLTDDGLARFAYLRASNMLWALGDPGQAKQIIDAAADTTVGQARDCIEAVRAVYLFAVDQPVEAVLASRQLVLENLPAIVGAEAAWALATIKADAGCTSEAVAIAQAGYAVAARCSDAPHMTFNIADAHVGALLLSGRSGDALEVAERVGRQAIDLPGAARLLGVAIEGRAALGVGRLDTACLLLERAARALSTSGHAIGWGYRYHVPLATAFAMRGLHREASAALATLDSVKRPFRSLDYERSLAQAWVAAGQGAVSEAVAVLHAAAELARASGRFAAEVLCLQTATQFGDRTSGSRLTELEAAVEGPRVAIAARFAAAVRDGNAAELAAASMAFEAIRDLVAAIDAAALAATAYRRQDLRGSALACAGRAEQLADECGGADTPMLRRASEPLPITAREREIAMLIGQGLTNRDVAERLTLSVRTIENHVSHAMQKTGTANRDELATLVSNSRLRRSAVAE